MVSSEISGEPGPEVISGSISAMLISMPDFPSFSVPFGDFWCRRPANIASW
jgi:hypothetical protein